jgi:hypothetical protein
MGTIVLETRAVFIHIDSGLELSIHYISCRLVDQIS